MKKTALALIVAVMALAIALPVGMAPAQAAPANPTVQQQIDEITQAVEQLRGLTAKTPIDVGFLNRDELRAKLVAEYDQDWPPEERVRTQDLMVMLGWLQPGQDLYQIQLGVMTEQIAGFYDPTDKKLYLITDQQKLSGTDEVAMAHEICHALQDQYFNLDQPPFDVKDGHEDDSVSAASAIAEGDAMRISNDYTMQYVSMSDLVGADLGGTSSPQFDAAPAYIKDSLLFPYEDGLIFVKSKAGSSNARANDLFRNVPDSTEQIMHPSSYPADQPQPVQIPDLAGALGPDWAKDEYNVLGEFDVMELFKPYMTDAQAERAADGWGGNLYEYWKRGQDKLLVQSYTWDTANDASEFAEAFQAYVPDRFPGAAASSQDGWLRWDAGGYSFGLKLDGSRTDVVQSTEGSSAQEVMTALGPGGAIPPAGQDWQSNSNDQTDGSSGTNWLVIGVVIALGILGLILIAAMLILKDRYRSQ